jgi:hypothetical protein
MVRRSIGLLAAVSIEMRTARGTYGSDSEGERMSDRLRQIETFWVGNEVLTRMDIGWLIDRVKDLEARNDFLENMYLERRTDHEERLVAEGFVRRVREENERLTAAYARLLDRLRDATPRSLMALTDIACKETKDPA